MVYSLNYEFLKSPRGETLEHLENSIFMENIFSTSIEAATRGVL